MVNYSIVMRSNPMDADAAKKAYASAQYSEVMDRRYSWATWGISPSASTAWERKALPTTILPSTSES